MAERSRFGTSSVWAVLASLLMGTTFVDLGCIGKVANNINPCGTILNCNAFQYDIMMHGAYPDWNVDPSCTIPGLCSGLPFPYGGGGGTTSGTGTTGTTTTGTTTTTTTTGQASTVYGGF